MDDIVKRIRQQSYFGLEPYEAADEIEQLRQRVQELEKENSIERNLRIGVEAGFDCANEELGRLKTRIENLMLDSEQWRTDCHTYCDAMHKREAEILSLQTERDAAIKLQDEANALLIEQARTNESLKQQRDELLSALEKIKMHSVSLADAQVVALEAIASVKEKRNEN